MVNQGYRKTDIGIIPDEWSVIKVKDIVTAPLSYGVNAAAVEYDSNLPQYIRITDITDDGRYDSSNKVSIDIESLDKYTLSVGDILFARTGASTGKTYLYTKTDGKLIYAGFLIRASIDTDKYDPYYVFLQFHTPRYYDWVSVMSTRSGQPGINGKEYGSYQLPMPSLDEQKAIATALSDIDALIVNLEKLIAKKKAIKQGAMQELLTGKRRLPGFDGEWKTKAISDIAIILDDHRIPVKESDREKMEGDIPYCGANGVLGYVNDYTIDGDIILIAEDGGYFDEYATRPIAYKMAGKCWVNNHAHILQSKSNTNQDYLFYGLVHKDIRDFITSGTRSKLNKSELLKIIVALPVDFNEQTAIASILTDMDNEITVLKNRLFKLQNIKTGMMSELLTGRIRLIDKGDA